MAKDGNKPLFSVELNGYKKCLEIGTVPEELGGAFKKQGGIILSKSARISKINDEIWEIDDEEYLFNLKGHRFSWNGVVSGNENDSEDNKRLLEFLEKDIKKEWVKNAKIEKSCNGETITITNGKKSLILKFNEEKNKVNKKSEVNIRVGKASIIEGNISIRLDTYPKGVEVERGSTLNFILPWKYDEIGGEKSEWHFSLELFDYRGDAVGSICEIKKDKYAQPDKDEGELKLSVCAPNREGYLFLFIWDDVPGSDNARLIYHLVKDLKIYWVKNATINKSDNGKTITVIEGENSLELKLKKDKVILEISGSKTYEYILEKKNSKLNIYKEYEYVCNIKCKLFKVKKWDKDLKPEYSRGEVGELIRLGPTAEKKESVEIRVITKKQK